MSKECPFGHSYPFPGCDECLNTFVNETPPTVSLAEGWAIVPVEPTEAMIAAHLDNCLFPEPHSEIRRAEARETLIEAWIALIAASPAHTPAPDTRLPEGMEGYAPCPTCHQYSHSLGGDHLAEAFNHFQSMFSHRGDGIPTQYTFDEKTRDAAQVLMTAARSTPHPAVEVTEKRADVLAYLESEARRFAGFYPQGSDGRNTFIIFADKIAASASATEDGV